MKKKIKVAIIGCGNIGTALVKYLHRKDDFQICCLTDPDDSRINFINNLLGGNLKSVSIGKAIRKADLIIEAANKSVAGEILSDVAIDRKGKKILIMSTGAVAENVKKVSMFRNCRVFVPSGAIAGLDAIRAAAGEIDSLTLSTVKPARSLAGAPFVTDHKINLQRLKKKSQIFSGNLRDAIRGFPQNINVAASLFLASQFGKLKVTIVADPLAKFNSHEITCKGKFGEIRTLTKNFPSDNPKTSRLAILSAISVLKNISSTIQSGN